MVNRVVVTERSDGDAQPPAQAEDFKRAFFQGLDDVQHERGRPVDEVIAESRRIIAKRRKSRNGTP